MKTDIIKLKNIYKTYNQDKKKILAIKNLSLNVPKGSFVSIMGPSGCGKSTITKIVSGIIKFEKGILKIDGEDCSRDVPRKIKQRIGYMFQWANLAEWLTVERNLYFPLEMFGYKKDASWKERAEKYLNMVGLEKYRNIYPYELSGGMKQRVGIARALMAESDILVFDQPFGAVDAITRKILATSVSKTAREEKKSVLIVTSDIDEAIQYSDYIYIMTSLPGRIKGFLKMNVTDEERHSPDFLLQDKFLDIKRKLVNILYHQSLTLQREKQSWKQQEKGGSSE